ncbi:hypothetical protein ACHAXA_004867 [Cyclostephanos tholiformis]|uniref:Pseudouridine synthase RsuA/RluA-like domain-containing protein n=1 Tax=Cyclostephanos tholiformis TaxID=382380 RepID=A0ABD3RRW8_9STRA
MRLSQLLSGGYNFNSLLEILAHWKPDSFGPGKLFTVHRLDRLTSGLVLIAKTSSLARSLGKCISERDGCEKIYTARVKGKFPLGLAQVSRIDSDPLHYHPWEFRYSVQNCEGDEGAGEGYPKKRPKRAIPPPCQYGEWNNFESKSWKGGLLTSIMINDCDQKKKCGNCDLSIIESQKTQSYAALGYWMADGSGVIAPNASLGDFITQCDSVPVEEMLKRAIGTISETDEYFGAADQSLLWLNFACPCRISSHKNGVCEAGDFADLKDQNDRKGIKAAQTSFALLSYDALSDTSLVLAKPVTGRTHQIRLHLQKLGHPIANDDCYGGELWFGDEEGKRICSESREWLNLLDRGIETTSDGDVKVPAALVNSTNADTPASDAEIYHAAANRPREDGESILDFIEKTCVWCARCRGTDGFFDNSSESKLKNESAVFRRTLMEYLVRSQGIWLHALQYSFKTHDETGQDRTLRYRTQLPSWGKLL